MATCPPNSTDCLLEAILAAQSGYNWNPPTFGATVMIGVLALVVATMTVFQGTLTAGPGRLKASSRAIGPVYYRKTQTEFSWIELRFRTTAWVPYIDHLGWFDSPGSAHPPPRRFRKYATYGAGWLNLLNSVPSECQQWTLTRCQTDYLPSDVQAAPARASIRAVVELAVLAGCDSVKLVKDLPLARGKGCQLSFRDHPYLGLAAVFDQFVIDDDRRNRVNIGARKRHTLYLAGQLAFQDIFMDVDQFDGRSSSRTSLKSLGVIDALNMRKRPTGELTAYERHSVESSLSPGTLKAISLGLLTWDSLDNCYGLPYEKFRIRRSILQLCRTCQCWTDRDGQNVLNSLDTILTSKSRFLAYDKNGEFSKALSGEPHHPQLGWTWLTNRRASSLPDGSGSGIGPYAWRIHQAIPCWFQWRPGGTVDFPMAVMPRDGNLLCLPVALDLTLKWLNQEDSFEGLTTDQKVDARFAIGHQLREVDYWLLHNGSIESAEQVFAILMQFVEPSTSTAPVLPENDALLPVPSITLRHPLSFERVRPAQYYKRGRAGSYERRPAPGPTQTRPFSTDREYSTRSSSSDSPHSKARRRRHDRKKRVQRDENARREEEYRRTLARVRDGRASSRVGRSTRVRSHYVEKRPAPRATRSTSSDSRSFSDELTDEGESSDNDSLHWILTGWRYICNIDDCYNGFDNAYELEHHCEERHHYSQADWAADSPSACTWDEKLVVALEWDVDVESGLTGWIKRRDSVEQISEGVLSNIWKTTDFEVNFEEAVEKTISSKFRELEQERYKLLDTRPWLSDSVRLSAKRKNHIVRLYEDKKQRLSRMMSRKLPLIRSHVEASLRESPQQPDSLTRYGNSRGKAEGGGSANEEESNNRGALVIYQDKRRPDRSHEDASESEQEELTEINSAQSQDMQLMAPVQSKRARKRPRGPLQKGHHDGRRENRMTLHQGERRRFKFRRRSTGDLHDHEDRTLPSAGLLLTAAAVQRLPSSSSQLIRGKGSPADMGMRALLIYRAVLFAALCALAADTSCIYETELGRRIVQVL